MEKLDRLGWAVSRSYEVGGTAFGVRTTSEAFGVWLDDTFAAYRIDAEVDPAYAIVVAEEGKPGKRYHLLYEETLALVRSRSLQTIARALLSQFELLVLPIRDDAIYAEMSVLDSNGHRAIVPPLLLPLLESFSHRQLERAGLVLPYSTVVAIDPGTGDLRPIPSVLDVPRDPLKTLPAADPSEEEPRASVDRLQQADIVVSFGTIPEPVGPVSKALALYRVGSHTLNFAHVGAELGLEGLRKLVERAQCVEIAAHGDKAMVEALTNLGAA
jgi:hypothetical protein